MDVSANADIDVDRLMAAIREAAASRNIEFNAADTSDIALPGAASQVFVQTNIAPALSLSPKFEPRPDDRYHVNDLLKYHDRDFVRNAYRAILKREPDEKGFRHHVEMLREGSFNKMDVLAGLRFSKEGSDCGVRIVGLKLPSMVRSLERTPIIGYVIQAAIGLVRLPAMIRHQRQFQGYLLGQQLMIADYLNEAQVWATQSLEENTSALANLATLTQEVASQRAQLRSLDTTVRETVLVRILEEQEQVRQAEAGIALVSDRLKQVSQTLLQTRLELEQQHGDLDLPKGGVKTLQRNLLPQSKPRTTDEIREWDVLYAAFEDHFRGGAEEVKERLKFYLPLIRGMSTPIDILDLGSGRGDWLELLQAEGLQPRGVELNRVMAERCRKQGLDVVDGEMIDYLRRLPDHSLDVVTAFHLIEHISFENLIRLVDEIKRTLRPGGLIMLETPSPENLVVAACNFYSDPTHHKPIYPQTLKFILTNKGFVDLRLQFLHPVEGSPFVGNAAGFEQLNTWFFGPRDFSVIARKA